MTEKFNVIIPLIHQNKRCYIRNQIQLAVVFPLRRGKDNINSVFSHIPIWLCIVPPPSAGEQYERTAILYHQQYISKLGVSH